MPTGIGDACTQDAGRGGRNRHRPPAWLLALLLLQGCSDLSRASYDTLRLALHGKPTVHPTAATVAAKPYYQMQATGPGGSAVLILGNLDGGRQAWYGAHGVVVFLEHGRVVQTSGLQANLDHLLPPADDPFVHGLQMLTAPVSYRMRQDWSPGYRYDVPVDATLTPAGRERIDILGEVHDVLRVDEQLAAPGLHHRATNHYWVDPHDGFIWKSEQHIAPGVDLQLVQLRPYRGQP
ncbi:YjbF family lipoprotein [Rhodanobacter geophilus]|uniref:YjbF family lipoprotein n=1 Tax=Rhodanobacter geophilus TaxID=3162488 RepID=A0ABV3QPK5_9GAMM